MHLNIADHIDPTSSGHIPTLEELRGVLAAAKRRATARGWSFSPVVHLADTPVDDIALIVSTATEYPAANTRTVFFSAVVTGPETPEKWWGNGDPETNRAVGDMVDESLREVLPAECFGWGYSVQVLHRDGAIRVWVSLARVQRPYCINSPEELCALGTLNFYHSTTPLDTPVDLSNPEHVELWNLVCLNAEEGSLGEKLQRRATYLARKYKLTASGPHTDITGVIRVPRVNPHTHRVEQLAISPGGWATSDMLIRP